MEKRPITVHYKIKDGLKVDTVFTETPNEYDMYIMPTVGEYVSVPEAGVKRLKVTRIAHKLAENKHDIFVTLSEDA